MYLVGQIDVYFFSVYNINSYAIY